MLPGGIEANPKDVELFNQTGIRPVRVRQFEFVEFPGFGEKNVLDELKHNVGLLEYVANEKVAGFIYVTQLQNRLNDAITKHLQYLQRLCGPGFDRSLVVVMTGLSEDAFEQHFCVDDVDVSDEYSIKLDDDKLDRLLGEYSKSLSEIGVSVDKERLFVVNSKPMPRNFKYISHFLSERESDNGELLFRKNATYFSLESRRRMLQHFQTATAPTYIASNDRQFSDNICSVLNEIALHISSELTKISNEAQSKLVTQESDIRAEIAKLSVDKIIEISTFHATRGTFGVSFNEAQQFTVNGGVADNLRIVQRENVVDDIITPRIAGQIKEFVVKFQVPNIKAKSSFVKYEKYQPGSLVNEARIMELNSDVKKIVRDIKPLSDAGKLLQEKLKILKSRRFEDHKKIRTIIEEYLRWKQSK